MDTEAARPLARNLDIIGSLIADVGWFAIGAQFLYEWRYEGPPQQSFVHLGGFSLIFGFWTIYGFYFRRPAIWIGNSVAAVLQFALLGLCIVKHCV